MNVDEVPLPVVLGSTAILLLTVILGIGAVTGLATQIFWEAFARMTNLTYQASTLVMVGMISLMVAGVSGLVMALERVVPK
ncbi:hypothetical protein JMJ58_03795 [Haloterrigena salifodinae]|uniref:Uncharacterized protein n=1 Tax=Haloterrigena salifodinae TaxID=2675099 RepID=A0A8T8E3G0_9EURY|nr:hypothetical protein [Haloterrigena salifodinae]QRV16032.1 hypothetical protein JMJ58_03795 [Haloterrigena salifodinae]